jgi:hypothetical protein
MGFQSRFNLSSRIQGYTDNVNETRKMWKKSQVSLWIEIIKEGKEMRTIMWKRKYMAAGLSLCLAVSLLSGCSSTSSQTASDDSSQAIYGEVLSVSDDSIQIQVGTLKEVEMKEASDSGSSDEEGSTEAAQEGETSSGEQQDVETANGENSDGEAPSGEKPDGEAPSGEKPDGEAPDGESQDGGKGNGQMPGNADGKQMSMLDLTDEEQEIAVTDDTVIKRQGMGAPGGGDGKGAPGEMPDGQNAPEAAEAGSDTDTETGEGQEQAESQTQAETQDESNSEDSQDNQAQTDSKDSQDKQDQMEAEEITLSDISEGDTVAITLDDDGNAAEITVVSMGMGGGESAQSDKPDSYEAVKAYTEDTEVEEEEFRSEGTDENAVLVSDGAKVSLNDMTISRTSKDSTGGDASSFYGVGAAVLTTDGTTYLGNSSIETDAAGGAGIFAYDKGTVYTADTDIDTTQDTSGGIHVAGGGTLYAWDMNVKTDGESSAAIRSDRGGGTMVVNGGSYTTNGVGSPAIYSTADIAVNKATLTANASEAICIEGLNSIHLYDSDLTGAMEDLEQNDGTWNVILYQSMSGDSEVGNSTFEMNGGTLTAKNGGMFYTTNTESTITLSDVDITYAKDNDFFLKCTGNQNQRGWGTEGENGADCLFTAIDQDMEGDVIWDSISNLDFYMTEKSTLTGAVTQDETCAGNGGEGYCNLYIGKDSTWIVTGDSTLSNLENAGKIQDENGKTVTVKGTDGTVYVEGSSSYTVTVNSYSDSADLSGASEATDWSDYQVERPSNL